MAYNTSTIGFKFDNYDFIAPSKFAGQLKNKVVIVTGGSSGIGRAVCKTYAAAGASVACVARRKDRLDSLVAEIESAGGHAIPVVADIAERGAAPKIVRTVEEQLGPVDILVNNAGIARVGPLVDEPENIDLWWHVHEVNVLAPAALIRAVLPSMIKRGTGQVISVSSPSATWVTPAMSAYASSKAGLTKFHEVLAADLEGTGVMSFVLFPGLVESELGAAANAVNEESNHPSVKRFLQSVNAPRKKQAPNLPGDVLVAMACEPRFKVMNGKLIDAAQDVEAILDEAEKEGMGKIGQNKLYTVNIGLL